MSDRIQVYEREEIAVSYDPARCIHAAECVRGLPAVFDPKRTRWIQLENGTVEAIQAVVAKCPTGALQARLKKGNEMSDQEFGPVVIQLAKNGPLLVRGAVRVQAADGSVVAEGDKLALCRCGGTSNAPLCDGTHAKNGFCPRV
jgi:uncharacterized Fe-S cluster protein YjdI